MGKSAKFYKKPSKQQRELFKLNSVNDEASGSKVGKKSGSSNATKASTASAQTKSILKKVIQGDVKELKKEKKDYVDLLYGKKTFKDVSKK